jgi:Protein of unknown function (DUF1566)
LRVDSLARNAQFGFNCRLHLTLMFRQGHEVKTFTLFAIGIRIVSLYLLATSNANAAGLNDSGQTVCYDALNTAVACSASVSGDTGVNPRQDGRYGRDAAAASGALTKVGAGAAGLDYTKIANNGSALAAGAALGTSATSWACTRDNVTGLVWEVKTATAGLRRNTHEYTWYSTAATNGGVSGVVGTNTCASTLSAFGNQCNTQNYVAAVNASALCGASDWRLPTQQELLSIVHSVDSTYFPNMQGSSIYLYWSNSTRADTPNSVWTVIFERGQSTAVDKSTPPATRNYVTVLVRGGL